MYACHGACTLRFIWPALIFIKVKAIVQYIHPNVFASRALQHYCVAICMRWVRGVHMRDDLDWNGKSVKRGFCDFPFFPFGTDADPSFLFGTSADPGSRKVQEWGPMWPRGSIWPGVKMRVLCGTLTCGGTVTVQNHHWPSFPLLPHIAWSCRTPRFPTWTYSEFADTNFSKWGMKRNHKTESHRHVH